MKLYYVTAWTTMTRWSHRRLMFTDKEAAMNYADTEKRMEDVRKVWMTVYDTRRTGSWGSVAMKYNGPIEGWEE